MDLFTQGALGAIAAQAATRDRDQARIACGFGFLAGLAPDLDALIRSPTDPLIFLEYHRHFTHALPFIPVGALICAGLLHGLFARRWQVPFHRTALFCFLGYATHGLLDAATTYGTMLLWPFSTERFAWSLVSIVDPLFTVPIAGLAAWSWTRRSPAFATAGLGWAALYMSLALFQHRSAEAAAWQLANARGHAPTRLEVKPSFGNILVWKSIYETEDRFYVDAVRAGWKPRTFDGTVLPKLNVARDFPWLDPTSRQANDIERFRFFSNGYIATDPAHPNRIVDIRYSFVPNDANALWSVELSQDAAAEDHVRYLTHRNDARRNLARLWRMIVEP